MLTFHPVSRPAEDCNELSNCAVLTEQSAWIDLVAPTAEEELAVEAALGIDVPTKDEMQDIATSSRLYQEGMALFMTATIITRSDTSHPEASAITFILTPERLITVRGTARLRQFPQAAQCESGRFRDGDEHVSGSDRRGR